MTTFQILHRLLLYFRVIHEQINFLIKKIRSSRVLGNTRCSPTSYHDENQNDGQTDELYAVIFSLVS